MLEEISNIFVYIDDIIIFNKTKEEHTATLLQVLQRLFEHHIKINFEKSKFFQSEVEVLGYVVKSDGIYPKQSYLENKIFYKEIKTLKDVQKLLGVMNWYRKFLPDLSMKLHAISDLLKKENKNKALTQEMKLEIERMKLHIRQNHKLCFPNFKKKFKLNCDASELGMGSVLYQEDRIIGYYSKKFGGPELNYTIVEKEYLSILLSMIHFRKITQGSYIEVYTDSKNCLNMNEFDYDLFHVDGKENVIADNLSRCFAITEEETPKIKEYIASLQRASHYRDGEYLLDSKGRIILKDAETKMFLKNNHVLFGHRGITTMYNNLKNIVYVKNVIQNLKDIISKCETCKRYKPRNNGIETKGPHISANHKFEKISSDIFGPFKLNDYIHKGKKEAGYILSITDIYSRFTRLYFYYNVGANKVIEALTQWERDYGKPKQIISDNGKQYIGRELKTYLDNAKITHSLIPTYSPRSNGISESLNKTIAFILAINKKRNIQTILADIEDTINMNHNRTIGTSPLAAIKQFSVFDPLHNKTTVKSRPYIIPPCKVNIGDLVYAKDHHAKKLDKKFKRKKRVTEIGRKGRWIRLEGDRHMTHIMDVKL
ncbi:endonuclease [Vairimorpha necatrix]|uniref:Endonuclease n=1 Tax=Vairimorpha necatrix TaxID=6039 RepID=A0AAX4JEY7_9MICR